MNIFHFLNVNNDDVPVSLEVGPSTVALRTPAGSANARWERGRHKDSQVGSRSRWEARQSLFPRSPRWKH